MKMENTIAVMARPKAILFDWDNTLANTWHIIHASLNKTFEAMGKEPWPFEDVKQGREGIHESLRSSFPRLFGEHWEEAREVYYASFLSCHLDHLEAVPDAEDMLRALRETDVYMGIVSNKTGKYLREEVAHLGWQDYFDKIIGAMDAEEDKPSAAPVYLALEGTDIQPDHEVWLVGDSATDVQAALNAGCQPYLFGEVALSEELRQDSRLHYPLKTFNNHRELALAIQQF